MGATQPLVEWRSCGLTTVGAVRKHNEDSYLAMPEKNLWVVADGMGGHARGDLASQAVVHAYSDFEPLRTLAQTMDDLEDRALKVNTKLREHLDGNPSKVMGSTIVLMHARQQYVFLLWAGDSRIYLYRKGNLLQVSHDHSFVQESVDKGAMTPSQAQNHPNANIITRAIGVHDHLYLDVEYLEYQAGDKFLLCSDGLFKDVTMAEIAEQLDKIPFKAAEGLIEMALSKSANDNVTIIVVEAFPLTTSSKS
ncbi:MAG: serine/threonine-protein phosphatase [Gammaproteobacteria bacterium]|nr:serine/threonine-protein phosphatase [Gammaproteobacteria bacterium]